MVSGPALTPAELHPIGSPCSSGHFTKGYRLMRSPKVRLRVEELGSRILPSRGPLPAGHVADMTHRAAVSPRPAAAPVNLHGTLQGTLFQVIRGPIDLGIQYGLTGAGELGGQPRFQVSGSLRRVGFITQ